MARHCPHCGALQPAERVANLADLITLCQLGRDCIDRGHPDLARVMLDLIVQHQGSLGLRARRLVVEVNREMDEREPPPGQ